MRHGITVHLVTGKARHSDYADNLNPPILHRKETFLPKEHPLWKTFRALTEAEEAAGMAALFLFSPSPSALLRGGMANTAHVGAS